MIGQSGGPYLSRVDGIDLQRRRVRCILYSIQYLYMSATCYAIF